MNIVVTGASRGIGRAICLYFAHRGWSVAFCSRDEKKVKALMAELRETFPDGEHTGIVCDVSDRGQVLSFCEQVMGKYDTIHCLVNNAGAFIPGESISEREGDLEILMATNLYSAYYTTRYLLEVIPPERGIFSICAPSLL